MNGKNMKTQRRSNLASEYYAADLGARVVAKSGIPGDRYHIGKLIFQSFKEAPDFVAQVDGARNQSETSGSVLRRSIRCALALKSLGLNKGDVIVIMAPNHVDMIIPIYASMFMGFCYAGTDITLGLRELEDYFKVNRPSVVFCQPDKASDVEKALRGSNTKGHMVTFGDSPYLSFGELLKKVSDDDVKVDEFKPADLDPEEAALCLCATSGTTGLPKSSILTHKNLAISTPVFMARFQDFPAPTRLFLLISPPQWLSATLLYILSGIYKFTRLQTSAEGTRKHLYDIINKYKPSAMLSSPNLMVNLLEEGVRDRCDFTCFETFVLGGSLVLPDTIDLLKVVSPGSDLDLMYGMSELAGLALSHETEYPRGSIGKPSPHIQCRLVDPVTLQDVTESGKVAELWCKGPSVFKGYKGDSQATKEAFVNGWFRTGDLFRRDEYNHYYFVDRLKTLLKYKCHQISPMEVEAVIHKHPGVHDVVVTGIADPEFGDLIVACVVLRAGYTVTAQEIKDIVEENLTESKQLRGGVIFLKELPLTVTNKIDRVKLKKMAAEMKRE